MDRRHARPRHVVSRRTLAVLRLLGWRHSLARQAYVHRLGNGRYGPVFRTVDDFEPLPASRAITQANRALGNQPLHKIPTRVDNGLDQVVALPDLSSPKRHGRGRAAPSTPPAPRSSTPRRPGRGSRQASA